MAQAGLGSLQGLHAIFPTPKPQGYFTDENIGYIQRYVYDKLYHEFGWGVIISKSDITRVLQRVIEERYETIPRMNQRAMMEILNEYRKHQIEKAKILKWEAGYYFSQQLYDPLSKGGRYDPSIIKLRNRIGIPRVGGTLRFRPAN